MSDALDVCGSQRQCRKSQANKRLCTDLCCGLTQGFQSVYKPQRTGAVQFAELLDAVASVDPEMRIRFTSPHPKDFSDDVLEVRLMANYMPLLLLLLLHVACRYVLLSVCANAQHVTALAKPALSSQLAVSEVSVRTMCSCPLTQDVTPQGAAGQINRS